MGNQNPSFVISTGATLSRWLGSELGKMGMMQYLPEGILMIN
jgi:hypothetical protein